MNKLKETARTWGVSVGYLMLSAFFLFIWLDLLDLLGVGAVFLGGLVVQAHRAKLKKEGSDG